MKNFRYFVSILPAGIVTAICKNIWINNNNENLDICYFIIIFGIVYVLSVKLVGHIQQYWQNKTKIDVIFLLIFFSVLFLPMSNIKKGEINISLKENRMLAVYKPLFEDYKINKNFGRDFEAWFSDRFFGRDKAIKRYNDLQYMLMLRKGNQHAFVGKDGWLYTKRFNSVEMYRNANLFSAEELKKIGNNIEDFVDKAHKNGVKQVYFVLSHDKESIYPEFYPEGFFKKNKQSRLEQLKNYLETTYPKINILDFSAKLRDIKKTGEILFCKTGTHMNDIGSYYEYLFLASAISKDFPEIKPLKLDSFEIKEDYICDKDIYNSLHLNNYNKENLKNKVLLLKETKATEVKKQSRQQKDYGEIYLLKNNQNLPTAILLGDSFSVRYYQYLAENFSTLYYIYTTAARNFVWFESEKEYIKNNVPEIIIIETTERFLHRFLTFTYPKE